MSQGNDERIISNITAEALLNHSECEHILGKACNGAVNLQLKSYTLEAVLYPNGFLGEYYNLQLCYDVAAADENQNLVDGRCCRELRAFIKRVPQENMEPEKEAIFRKEASLYGTLLQRMRRYSMVPWSSRPFYLRDDLIVLEHLAQLGFTLCPQITENLSEHYILQVLRGLAAQHAASITLEVKENICIGDTNPELQHEITVTPAVPWYTTGLRAILAVIQLLLAQQSPEVKEAIENRLPTAIESVYEMTNRSPEYRNVLCHRDIWRGNIFYRSSATATPDSSHQSALFVDYQTARYCPPAIDIIFALFMNLDKQTRKSKEHDYLRFYFECLQRHLSANDVRVEKHITLEELLASYKEFQLFGLFYKSIAFTILKVPRECVTNEYVHVERTKALLKLMDVMPEFRKCLVESVMEIIEFLKDNNS